jgi:hypothetical protein
MPTITPRERYKVCTTFNVVLKSFVRSKEEYNEATPATPKSGEFQITSPPNIPTKTDRIT